MSWTNRQHQKWTKSKDVLKTVSFIGMKNLLSHFYLKERKKEKNGGPDTARERKQNARHEFSTFNSTKWKSLVRATNWHGYWRLYIDDRVKNWRKKEKKRKKTKT